jgi:hypothetical protein
MKVDIQLDKVVKLIKSRIIDPENNYELLRGLIENAHLEEALLNISTFEKISFFIYKDQIDVSLTPSVERLSLVFPPSFECIYPIRLTGHYLVKYPSSSVALPVQLPAFKIDYNVIIVLDQDSYRFKQEHVRLSEKH